MNERTLVLNQDGMYLNIVPWQDIIYDAYMGNVTVLEESERVVRSPSVSMRIPLVVVLNQYVPDTYRHVYRLKFSRENVFIRDKYICQYCGTKTIKISQTKGKSTKALSKKRDLEHVHPISRSGPTIWENVVCSCRSCNSRKDARTPEEANMKLLRKPYEPKDPKEVLKIKIGNIQDSWKKYLGL
jgi:5-methylcytosine-specific restriction endonuclease McrA